MKPHRRFTLGAILTALCLFAFSGHVHSLGSKEALQEEMASSDANLTPPPGSPLRQAILDAMRQEVKRIHNIDAVFVVEHLKSKGGWAWLHTLPASKDGSSRYEDILRGTWVKRHSAIMCLLSARHQDAAVALLQQILITQPDGKHITAYPFNFNMLGASRMALFCVTALANGTTITCKLRLDQNHS